MNSLLLQLRSHSMKALWLTTVPALPLSFPSSPASGKPTCWRGKENLAAVKPHIKCIYDPKPGMGIHSTLPRYFTVISPTPSQCSLSTDDLTSFFLNTSHQGETPSGLLHQIHKSPSIHAHLFLSLSTRTAPSCS